MKKHVFIYGCEGSMGKRYRAILEHLGHSWAGTDPKIGVSWGFTATDHDGADGIIVATPTDTHTGILDSLLHCGKPILCEKPITKDMDELRELMADVVRAGARVQMVSQYDWLGGKYRYPDQPSSYDYFRTGPDGLPWDALQIIWHAAQTPSLAAKSPVWDCVIDGCRLSLSDMDAAYVEEIKRWLESPRNDVSRILDSHEKVAKLEAAWRAKRS